MNSKFAFFISFLFIIIIIIIVVSFVVIFSYSIDTPSIDINDLEKGGPKKDGIPSLDNPRFTSILSVAWDSI